MVSQVYDGRFFKASLQASQALLEQHREEINELNVFPVPDGDTGTNMVLTVRGAVKGVIDSLEDSAGKVAAVAARSALLAARGNSGVLFSQILMGIARGLEGKIRFSPSDFAQALTLGAEKAYTTLVNPVEGTILTVIREAANAAHQAAQQGANLGRMMDEVVLGARAAIDRTPELLPILKEAGVVDAGGQGLYYVLEAMRSCAWQESTADRGLARRQPVAPVVAAAQRSYGYEIELIIRGQDLPFEEMRRRMAEMGESVLVVGSETLIRVHVHTSRPDRVLAYALDTGPVEDISVQNLDQQVRSVASDAERRSLPA
jgi:DAK2 domain fusion protein YloV